MRKIGALVLIVAGVAATAAAAFALFSGPSAILLLIIFQGPPAWALSFCLASDDGDFPGATLSRSEWLRLLPWTFVLAPLVIPNIFLLGMFIRDSRADGGRSIFSWDRMRPAEGSRDHHWPD